METRCTSGGQWESAHSHLDPLYSHHTPIHNLAHLYVPCAVLICIPLAGPGGPKLAALRWLGLGAPFGPPHEPWELRLEFPPPLVRGVVLVRDLALALRLPPDAPHKRVLELLQRGIQRVVLALRRLHSLELRLSGQVEPPLSYSLFL